MFVWIYTCLRRNSRGNETWGDCGYLIDLVHYMQTQIKTDWGLSIKIDVTMNDCSSNRQIV